VIALEQDLQQLFGEHVELLTERGLGPYPQRQILVEAAALEGRPRLQHAEGRQQDQRPSAKDPRRQAENDQCRSERWRPVSVNLE
jgi:hypothetical protein